MELINQEGNLPHNALLVTMDATALFTNTPQKKLAETATESLIEDTQSEIPSLFLVRLLEIIQENNIFEFNGDIWKQKIGAAMGQRHVPSSENIFMARRIDNKIEDLARQIIENNINPL